MELGNWQKGESHLKDSIYGAIWNMMLLLDDIWMNLIYAN